MVRAVDISKVPDLVTLLEPRQGRRAPVDNSINPREWRHQNGRRYVIPKRLLGGGRLLFGWRGDFIGEVGEVLVYLLLDGIHEARVVVPKMDNARPRRPYFFSNC